MKKRFLSAFLAIAMVFGMMPTAVFAEEGQTQPASVIYGQYDEDGNWVYDPTSDGTAENAQDSGITVSKKAVSTGNPNEYQISLEIQTSTKTSTVASKAATVLVIDTSGSMEYCAECGGGYSVWVGGMFGHYEETGHEDECQYNGDIDYSQSRMKAAKDAALSFLATYGGVAANSGRYLAIVSFNTSASTVLNWTDVSGGNGSTGYEAAETAIGNLSAGGGTNLDHGLITASDLMNDNAVSSVTRDNKFTIALTDGIPTYYMKNGKREGGGSEGSSDINTATAATATSLRNLSSVYTVCFGVAGDVCYTGGPTVGDFLKDSIATGIEGKTFAYNADNTAQLNAAFASITEDITSGLKLGGNTVTDPMTDVVGDFKVTAGETEITQQGNGFEWELADVEGVQDPNDPSVTIYTYTLTYTIQLNTEDALTGSVKVGDTYYYPTNERTYLTIGEEEIEFPIPAVPSPMCTVIFDEGDHGSIEGAENGQIKHTVQMHDATPEPPKVNANDDYYFVGWEPQVAESVTSDVVYEAQYEKKDIVTVKAKDLTVYYNGSQQSVSGVEVTGLPEGYTIDYTAGASGTNAGFYTSFITGSGIIIEEATGADVTHKFKVNCEDGTLEIKKIDITIKADDNVKIYDGVALTDSGYTITAGALASGDEIESVSVVGSQTVVGSSTNVASDAVIMDGDELVNNNYNITYEDGTLTVNADTAATLEAIPYGGEYDGQSHEGITSLKLKNGSGTEITTDGWTITYTYDGKTTSEIPAFKDAGVYQVSINASNPNYRVIPTVTVDVKITPKAVKLTSATDTKVYDGTALTNDTVTPVGFVSGEGASYIVTGSQTDVGTSKNTFTYVLNEGTLASNYTITTVEGDLTVTPITKAIVITAGTNAKVYDGLALTDNTYTYTQDILVPGDVLTAVVEGTITNVGTVDNIVTSYKVMRGGTDVTKNYNFGQSINGKLSVTKRPVTLTSGSGSKVYDGTSLTNDTVYVSGEGFVGNEGAIYSVTGSQTNVGTSKNTFTYTLAENTMVENYDITKVEGNLTVSKSNAANMTVTSYTGTYDGNEHTVSVSVTDLDMGDEWNFTYALEENGEYSATIPTCTDVEDTPVTVYVKATSDNYLELTGTGTITITPKSVIMTSASDSKMYDGNALTNNTVTAEGFVDGEGASYDVTGSQLDVGSSDNTFTYDLNRNTKDSNYEITKNEGTLTVTPVTTEIILTAGSATKMYDGMPLTTIEYSVNSMDMLASGDHLIVTVGGSQTDVGTGDSMITSYKVMRGETDVTENYTFGESVDGTLTVTKRAVTLTSATSSKTYDGNALTNYTVSVSGDGFVGEEGAIYNVTGSQLDVGSSNNTFTYTLKDNTKAANYDITTVEGILTVTSYNGVITVVAKSDTKVYDGAALTNNDYEVHFTADALLQNGDEIVATVEGSITDVGEVENVVTDVKVMRGKTDVTANYSGIQKTNGSLSVTQKPVTITSASDTKEYDGTPLTNEEVTAAGFVNGEGAVYYVTGSQTNVGTSKNTFTYTLKDNTKAANYDITKVEGNLIVTPIENIVVTITGNTDTVTYDGKEHEVKGYTFSCTDPLYKESDFTFNGTAVAKGTEAGTYQMGLNSAQFTNNNQNFKAVTFVVVDGSLTINPIENVVVTITGNTDTITYDGAEHKVEGYTFSCENALYKESDFTFNGTAVAKGTEAGTYNMGLNASQFTNNNPNFKTVTFNVIDGSLTINPISDEVVVTITENSGTENYDGTVKSVTGYEVTSISNALYTANDFAFNGAAEVKGVNPGVYNMELKAADFQNTSKNFTNVKFVIVDGTLTINPQITVEYYLEDLEGNTTKIESVDNGQNNPFIVNYGEGFTIVIGEGEGTYTAPAAVTADNISYVFDSAVEALSADAVTENVTVKLYYSVDNWNDEEDDDDKGDGIADKYQAKVTYKVYGGTWDGTDASNKIAVFTMYTYADGVWTAISPVPVLGNTIPDVSKAQPDADHTTPAYWSPAPYATDKVVNGAEYVYTFTAKGNELTFTFDANGGAWTNAVDGYVMGEGNKTAAKGGYLFFDEVAKIGTEPVREGYEFLGWFNKNNNGELTGKRWSFAATKEYIFEDTTVYAKWNKLPEKPVEPEFSATLIVNCQTETGASLKYEEIALTDAAWSYTPVETIVDGTDKYIYEGITAYSPAQALNGTAKNGEIVLLLLDYTLDNWNDKEDKEDGGDGIPDKYQAKVTYVVVNGTWDGTATEDKIEIFTVKNKSAETGEWTATGVTLAGTIPTGMQPDNKHIAPGAWDVAITDETPVTESVTYTYTFDIDKVLALDVQKRVDKIKAKVGDTVTYTIIVSNTGNVALPDVIVTDTFSGDIDEIKIKGELPEGVTYEEDGVFVIDELDVDEAVTIIFTYKTTSADKGTLTNTVVAESTPDDVEDPVKDEDDAENVEVRNDITPTGPIKPVLSKKDHFAYIIGYPDGTVRPQNNITRAEVATIFFRLLEEESRENFWSQYNEYTDVSFDDWFNNAISTLSNAGIITGYPDGTFGPNLPITRAEFATIAARFAEVEYNGGNTFTDVPEDHWAARYIALAQHLGYIQGYPDGTFKPNQFITRAEAMTLINRVLERAVEEEHMLEDMLVFIDNVPGTWYYEAVQEATNSHEYERRSELVPNQDFKYEYWIEILTPPDWAALEQVWSEVNSY